MNSPETKATKFPKPNAMFLRQLLTRKLPLNIEFKAAGGKNSDLPVSHCFEIAIVGRSNVGKSSLINYVSGQKNLARTSRTPGRTQTINLFSVEKNRFMLVDLPGYGYAESNKSVQAEWQRSMSEFLKERSGLFAFMFLLDIRRDVNEEDVSLFHWLLELGLTPLVVHTKCDKIHKGQWFNVRKSHAEGLGIAPEYIVTTSADTNIGRDALFAGLSGLFSQMDAQLVEDQDEGSQP